MHSNAQLNDDYQSLIDIFSACFTERYRTILVAGDDEPLYQPARHADEYHQVVFAHGFFNSALHEVAHWCIAGEKRRQLFDYGYWYEPDGRDALQQREFEQVEVRPQALENLFADACDRRFQVSIDNLSGAEVDTEGFAAAVKAQKQRYIEQGLPKRAQQFCKALADFYGVSLPYLNVQSTREIVSLCYG